MDKLASNSKEYFILKAFISYSLMAEYNKMKVGITNNINANALTAGSQNVSAVQIVAHTPKIPLNIFLKNTKRTKQKLLSFRLYSIREKKYQIFF